MKFARHLAGYFPANLAGALASFGAVYAFTRLLGAEDYGRYALMFSVLALVHTITLAPAEAAAYRFMGSARADGTQADHFATVRGLLLRSIAAAALIMAVLTLAVWHLPEYRRLLPWIALLLPAGTLLQASLEAHRASQQVARYVLVYSTKLLGGFLLGALIAWQTDFGAAAPFMGLLGAALLLVLFEGPWFAAAGKGGRSTADRRRTYLMYGLPVAAALSLDILLSAADRFLIALFLGEASVGEYAAGYGVADKTVLLICAWAAMAGSPLIMQAYEENGPRAATAQAGNLIRPMLMLGLPAATGLALVARPLSEALIGEDVRAGAMQIIPWIAFAGLMNGLLIHYFSEAFQLAKKTGERALLMIVPAGFNIAANLVLIPLLGLTGAVVATLASYAIGMILLARRGARYVILPVPLADTLKIALACLAMWPVLLVVPDFGGWAELTAKAAAGALTYAAAAWLLDAGGARSFVRDRLNSSAEAQTP